VNNDEVEMGENGSIQKSNFLKVTLHVSLTVENFLAITRVPYVNDRNLTDQPRQKWINAAK
jgi:hypothetical protein